MKKILSILSLALFLFVLSTSISFAQSFSEIGTETMNSFYGRMLQTQDVNWRNTQVSCQKISQTLWEGKFTGQMNTSDISQMDQLAKFLMNKHFLIMPSVASQYNFILAYSSDITQAVKKFQVAYGIKQTGAVGSTTLAKINSIICGTQTSSQQQDQDLTFMNSFAGKYYFDVNFFKNNIVDRRLVGLLPKQQYKFLKNSLLSGPSGIIVITNGVLNFTICQKHNCGNTKSLVAVDIASNKFYLIINNNGVKSNYFEDTQNGPKVVSDWGSEN